jgi:hypothetical protein
MHTDDVDPLGVVREKIRQAGHFVIVPNGYVAA